MAEEIFYEFDNFRLDPLRRNLLQGDQPRPLTPTAFDLLAVFVENHGQTLSKTQLIKRVWADAVVTDNNFGVTLNAVRRALGESARQPRHIVKVPQGYRFVTEVQVIRIETSLPAPRDSKNILDSRYAKRPPKHSTHIYFSSFVYATLYATCVFLEVAYEFEKFHAMAWRVAPLVFIWMGLTSIAGLKVDQQLASRTKAAGLAPSVAIFLSGAALVVLALTRFLPSFPITQSTLQSYPAQAAYLKDTAYFLVLAVCFVILPFHFVVTIEGRIQHGRDDKILNLLSGDKLSVSPAGTIYPRFWALVSLLVVLGAFSLVMTSQLLDHLKPGTYMNFFTQLVYLRGVLFFGLGVECLIWYYQAVSNAKRECLGHS